MVDIAHQYSSQESADVATRLFLVALQYLRAYSIQSLTCPRFHAIQKAKNEPHGNDNVRVHLMDTTQSSREKFVCFERALIPGYLKGRFFIRDPEYPSSESSTMKMTMEPHLPRGKSSRTSMS